LDEAVPWLRPGNGPGGEIPKGAVVRTLNMLHGLREESPSAIQAPEAPHVRVLRNDIFKHAT
jgi:hypothetical protein